MVPACLRCDVVDDVRVAGDHGWRETAGLLRVFVDRKASAHGANPVKLGDREVWTNQIPESFSHLMVCFTPRSDLMQVYVRFDFDKKYRYFSLHDDVYHGEIDRSRSDRPFELGSHLIMFDVGKHIGQEGDIGTIIFTLVGCVAVDQLELLQNSCTPHREKYSKIIIDYKAVTKTGMTGIYCNGLGAVDIAYNPIIIISQPLSLL